MTCEFKMHVMCLPKIVGKLQCIFEMNMDLLVNRTIKFDTSWVYDVKN